jgi:SAM-dependent methyltransferase
MNSAALPAPELLQQQAAWLAAARSRLLRQAAIARRRRVLDLGAGYGSVTPELARRSGGTAVALDREWEALQQIDTAVTTCADAHRLPFAADSFDLVFCQCVLLWLSDVATAVAEIQRILQPGGVLIALEPDYGGLLEHPPAIVSRDLWLSVLARLGADPFIGRKLPGLLHKAGFQVRVSLLDELTGAEDGRFAFLRTLPLTEDETVQLAKIENTNAQFNQAWQQIAHLPFFLITAEK